MSQLKLYYLIIVFPVIVFGCKEKYDYEYYENGEIRMKCELKNERGYDKCEEYYRNGTLKAVGEWVNDTLNGEAKYYNSEGILETSMIWRMGKAHGKSVDYYSNGIVKNSGMFENNMKVGSFYFFDSLGRKTKWKDFVVINGEELLNQKICYDSLGEIITEQSDYLMCNLIKGKSVLTLKSKKHERISIVYNIYDNVDALQENSQFDTIHSGNLSVELKSNCNSGKLQVLAFRTIDGANYLWNLGIHDTANISIETRDALRKATTAYTTIYWSGY